MAYHWGKFQGGGKGNGVAGLLAPTLELLVLEYLGIQTTTSPTQHEMSVEPPLSLYAHYTKFQNAESKKIFYFHVCVSIQLEKCVPSKSIL